VVVRTVDCQVAVEGDLPFGVASRCILLLPGSLTFVTSGPTAVKLTSKKTWCNPPALSRHAAITNAPVAGAPLRDAQILARHADPRTTEHYDRARGNLDRHAVHFLTACVAGV
jgi:hypothetical protein